MVGYRSRAPVSGAYLFVGIDVIGAYLTEINVTSPTGIQKTNRLSGTKIEADIWEAIEKRFAKRRAN